VVTYAGITVLLIYLQMLILCKLNRIEEALMILEDFLFIHEVRVGRPRDSAQVFPDCVSFL
jgi:hypothetical protein